MVIIDGSFLVGVAAVLTSLATLLHTARGEPWREPIASPRQIGEQQHEKLDRNGSGRGD